MKKRIIMILTGVFLLACMFGVTCAPAEEPDQTITLTEEEAVHIGSVEDLALLTENPAGSYILDCDLDMMGVRWIPIRFSGTLDGNGYSINNLTLLDFDPETGKTVDGNGYKYNTHLMAFFSVLDNATIRNLSINGASVYGENNEHAYAAILTGISTHSTFENVHVSGTVCLYCGAKMAGVAGLVGFGTGTLRDSSADVTLIYVDTNQKKKCEQFMGGGVANGFMDCYNVSVNIDGYASVYGYAHCGGIIGMHRQHEKRTKANAITHIFDCKAAGRITFFEKNTDRRAYCKGIIGERLNKYVKMENNDDSGFERNEIRKYKEILLPEGYVVPER